jgi:peptidyl-prolyl cis-trans isomerase B (cyclophilin B)
MTDPVVPPAAPAYQPAPVGQKTNVLAIVALILGIVIPIGGIICGPIALSQIKRTGEAGRGLAIAGIIIGIVFTLIGIIAIIGYAVALASVASLGSVY